MRTPHVPFLFAACLLAAAPAAQGTPPAPSFAPAPRSRVLFDTAPDGALWAKGRSYKMCFAAGGARSSRGKSDARNT